MVLWHEDAYTRTDENGAPISLVSLAILGDYLPIYLIVYPAGTIQAT